MSPCRVITDSSGHAVGWVCSRGRQASKPCVGCGRPSDLLCDYPLHGEKNGKTCDKPICRRCAKHVGHNRDFCPAHARMTAPELPWREPPKL